MSITETSLEEALAASALPVVPVTELRVVTAGNGNRLRRTLVSIDAAAATSAWALSLGVGDIGLEADPGARALVIALTATVALASLWLQGLYRSRVCNRREAQRDGILRTSLVTAATAAALWASAGLGSTGRIWLGATLTWVLLAAGRATFQSWLRASRSAGRHTRSIAVVGGDEEARQLIDLLAEHPELGYRVVGMVASDRTRADTAGVPWISGFADAPNRLSELGISGAVVVLGALAPGQRRHLVDQLWEAGVHVQVSTGMSGLDHRRIRAVPMGHEPLFYLEASASRSPSKMTLKRSLDVVLAAILLLLTAPVVAGAAAAVKAADRGPVLFRQERLGIGGRRFRMIKLRTMVTDADSRLAEVLELNARKGPLFKAKDDPRVTGVGRLLRATSIDELPQLWNVLRGEMSLVGPRPALAKEAAAFDGEMLAARLEVRPGITGLWQIEARDNPSYNAYRRLDMFYVRNWSLGLDLYILSATVGIVGLRGFKTLLGAFRRRPELDRDLSVS